MTKLEQQDKALRDQVDAWAIKTYLDWFNNYSSIEKMAQDYNMSVEGMRHIIEKSKEIYKKSLNLTL